MRRGFLYTFLALTATLFAVEELSAQAQIRRTEFICYDKREDANKDIRTGIERYIAVEPTLQFESETGVVRAAYEQSFEVEPSWNDYNTYLHIENVGADYTIFINGVQIASTFDQFTPSEFLISPYLDQGINTLAIVVVEEPYMSRLDEGLQQASRPKFENSYIFSQRRLAIYDFNVRLLPDVENRFAELHLDVLADNSFTTDEVISIGYDIYAPDGKLMEYSVNDLELVGSSRDTLSFKPYIYHSNPNKWSPSNPKLYDLMLYTKRSGILWEYIPLKVGFVEYGYNEMGEITAFGKPLTLNKSSYNAAADRKTTEQEVKALKSKGINCLCPDYPQPRWFYDICDRVGIYVIDCAAISSTTDADNRNLGGTPANAPELCDVYTSRVESMYRRAQNHPCIIAFRLAGNNSGNGYNMYKAYEHLKSMGDSRAIIYEGADGEWNSDL
jgi:beta-galactosidase